MPRRLLIVDDEPLSLRATRFVLEQGGFTVTSFESPKLALDHLNAQPWDLFLFDVDMPDYDGFELCRRARQNQKTSMVPVIFVTGYHASELTARCEESGGNDMISKPFSFPGLLQKCWTWVFWSRRRLGSTVSDKTQL
ncbi:MAG: response regulator [Verrucomicrobia bacterium]|nr:response regulator [Verrucomicrobiota bacterium]